MRLRALKFLLFLLALLPAGCHYAFTGPAIWSHNSSSAFDAWLFMWFCAIALPIGVFFLPLGNDERGSKE